MTPQEISAHAIELGITPELYPELWDSECQTCGNVVHKPCGCWPDGSHTTHTCNLPDPDSDDPRCPLWDGFYMRALGYGLLIDVDKDRGFILRQGWATPSREATPTAALRAAFLAKGASK